MSESAILTGQFVQIEQVPANVGERIIACAIDLILLILYILVSIYLLHILNITFSNVTGILLLIILYLPVLCYSLLFEIFNQGQSIGKQVLGIRVIKTDGTSPTLSAYLLRWLLFPIDVPLTSGLGLLIILLTKNKQRLGDLAAGTMVIKEQDYKKIQVTLDEFNYLSQDYHPTYPQVTDLSLEQINVISKTLNNTNKKRSLQIPLLASKLQTFLTIKTPIKDNEFFLQTILRDYQYYALEDSSLI